MGDDQRHQHHQRRGRKLSVCSLICVAAWNIATSKPTSPGSGITKSPNHQRGQPQRFTKDIDRDFRRHGETPPKLLARVPMISAQPSCTNSMILNGKEMIQRRQHHPYPSPSAALATTRVDDQERNEDHEADLERGLKLGGDERRHQNGQRRCVWHRMSVRLDRHMNSSRSLLRVCASMRS